MLHLSTRAAQLLHNGLSPSTLRVRKSQWHRYFVFCQSYNLVPLPASAHQLCLFATYLLDVCHLTSSSIPNYLASLKSLHLFHNQPVPPLSHASVTLTLAGIRRGASRPAKQAAPITLTILHQLVAALSHPHLSGYRAAYLVAFYGLLRKSNVVPTSSSLSPTAMHVCRGDFSFTEWGLLLRIRLSKQRNYGDSHVVIPFYRAASPLCCPVTACQNHFLAHPASSTSPAFHTATCGPITAELFVNRLRSVLHQLGLRSIDYSGHSFRRGGATLAANLSVADSDIQLFGDWASSAYQRYLSSSLRRKTELAKTLAGASASI